MQDIHQKIESLLFLEAKPLTVRKLANVCKVEEADIEQALTELQQLYAERKGGVTLVREGSNVQLMTASTQSAFVQDYVQKEDTGELTQPSLETLTIIAYRGPVPKNEIELIRGVNCSLILRNLLIRGLVEEVGMTETDSPVYQVTLEFLRHLGVSTTAELPNYEDLNRNIHLQELLETQKDPEDFFHAPE